MILCLVRFTIHASGKSRFQEEAMQLCGVMAPWGAMSSSNGSSVVRAVSQRRDRWLQGGEAKILDRWGSCGEKLSRSYRSAPSPRSLQNRDECSLSMWKGFSKRALSLTHATTGPNEPHATNLTWMKSEEGVGDQVQTSKDALGKETDANSTPELEVFLRDTDESACADTTGAAPNGCGCISDGSSDLKKGRKLMVLPTNESSEHLLKIRHTSAHVLAMAIQMLFPEAQVAIDSWTEKGFCCDFDLKRPITKEDLKKIEREMNRIISCNLPVVIEEVSRNEAEKRVKAISAHYKFEILEELETDPITIYKIGAYWKGNENSRMLQRIHGTAWETEEQLKSYQIQVEEARRRDHRRLVRDLNFFSIQEEAGQGLVFWHPNGARVRDIIEGFCKEMHFRHGYQLLYTPQVGDHDLWKKSGHHDFYKESMFDSMQIEENLYYQIRPMNCPLHILYYKYSLRSYRELPMRLVELGTVFRYERSGALHGLFRARMFTQDDGHIFCRPDQIRDEIRGVLDLTEDVLKQFCFSSFEVNLSTRPEKAVGSNEIWEEATVALKEALEDKGWKYGIDEGGGAFYGPKIDVKIEDAIGRKWQCSTIQVDFNLPERFDLVYVDADTLKKQPVMIHRAILGSIERFIGILLENYAGDFPLWLAPVQARLLPVTDQEVDYCRKVVAKLKERDIRAEMVFGDRLGKLIRNAETQKIPVMAVVGPKEVEGGTLAVRLRHGGDLGTISVNDLADRILLAVSTRSHVLASSVS